MLFHDRADAGRQLAEKLSAYANRSDVLILALPRGGVPVAYQIAIALNSQLDVFVVRKLGVPGREELAMGAIASGNVRVLNQHIIHIAGITNEVIQAVTEREQQELLQRERSYRDSLPFPPLLNRTVILVDDGLATGATMFAATVALRRLNPTRIVVGVPVAAEETCREFRDEVDEIICVLTPEPFMGVGLWYEDFSPVSSEEVRRLLADAQQRGSAFLDKSRL